MVVSLCVPPRSTASLAGIHAPLLTALLLYGRIWHVAGCVLELSKDQLACPPPALDIVYRRVRPRSAQAGITNESTLIVHFHRRSPARTPTNAPQPQVVDRSPMSNVINYTLQDKQGCYICSKIKPKLLAVAAVRAGPRPIGKCCL